MRLRDVFLLVVLCWACGGPNEGGFQYNQQAQECDHCNYPNVRDGSHIEFWESFGDKAHKVKTFDTLGDIKEWYKLNNREMKMKGKDCQNCGKRFNSRGISLHLRHCKAKEESSDGAE